VSAYSQSDLVLQVVPFQQNESGYRGAARLILNLGIAWRGSQLRPSPVLHFGERTPRKSLYWAMKRRMKLEGFMFAFGMSRVLTSARTHVLMEITMVSSVPPYKSRNRASNHASTISFHMRANSLNVQPHALEALGWVSPETSRL
jgi:hypothetical protein